MSRITVATRIQRLLAMLQWIASSPDGVEISEVCARFSMGRSELLAELRMAAMIGDGSANFDDMPFQVIIEEQKVQVWLLAFRRPLRMTRAEQLALLTAVGALLGTEADPEDALARALTKLAAQLGVDPGATLEVALDHDGGPVVAELESAVSNGRRVRFSYWAFGRDAVSSRRVEPWNVFTQDDQWYLVGLDVDRGEARTFRLDRLSDLETTDETCSPPPRDLPNRIDLVSDLPVVELDLPRSAWWVAEAYPVKDVTTGPSRIRLSVPVAGIGWLERLLLRLGPDAQVLRIDPGLEAGDLAATAAVRVLDRYR